MVNDLKIFDYKGNNVRTVQKNNETWFVLKDVCEVLELTNASVVANRLDHDEVTKFDLGGLSGEINIINESGFYNVILRSDKPEAKKFKKWVTNEVLPSIRKHGLYATEDVVRLSLENPAYIIELLTNYQKEQKKRKETEKQLAEKTLQLDENKEWFTVKRIASLSNKSWKFFNWRLLKNTSEYMGYEVKKVFDANYGAVNAYHIDVWKQEYSDCINI
jgi:prophage antirepressor-like protein